ncbi:hypothetical protein V1L52_02195 [Treponema sp. HNW]|uniref:hypothetical protein n=1 Tax=Treponema sp. HNW TaxID=3116654 RepID=UPI003D12D694
MSGKNKLFIISTILLILFLSISCSKQKIRITENAGNFFIKILDDASEKAFSSKSDYEITVAVCSKLLGKNNDLKTDELFLNMTEEDIINIFCGN